MHITRLALALAAVLLTACATVPPSTSSSLTCTARGVTINTPSGWTVEREGCHFKGPNNVHLVEINPTGSANAGGTGSFGISMVSTVSSAVLRAGMSYKEVGPARRLSVGNNPAIQREFTDLAERHIVQVVIEKDKRYWQLLLQVPKDQWANNQAELMKVMYSAVVN